MQCQLHALKGIYSCENEVITGTQRNLRIRNSERGLREMYREGYRPRLARFIQHCIKRSAENNKDAARRHAVRLCGLCINGKRRMTQAWLTSWL
jgi:hypothetical protein